MPKGYSLAPEVRAENTARIHRIASAKWRREHPERALLVKARVRAKATDAPFDITEQDVVIPEFCPLLGIKLKARADGNKGPMSNSPSLDKIRPALGYVKGNVWVISHRANQIKSDASPEELERIAFFLKKLEAK